MRDGIQSHPVRGLRGERGTPAAGAKEQEALVFAKNRLVVRALGINPEFEHAARAMKRAGYAPFAIQLADVANIDKDHVIATMKSKGVLD